MTPDVDEVVRATNSLRGALFALREAAPLLGKCHIGYEFMIREKGHIRSDLIAKTTLPASFWEIYHASGGSTLDPVLSRVSNKSKNFRLDLSPEGKSPFFDALADLGCVSISNYTLPRNEIFGRLAFTVLEDQRQRDRQLDQAPFIDLLRQAHIALRRHGHIRRYFGLTPKECATLTALSQGQGAADVAEAETVTLRSIEKRLQKAREKLHARTTVEAVYKAALYGILHGEVTD